MGASGRRSRPACKIACTMAGRRDLHLRGGFRPSGVHRSRSSLCAPRARAICGSLRLRSNSPQNSGPTASAGGSECALSVADWRCDPTSPHPFAVDCPPLPAASDRRPTVAGERPPPDCRWPASTRARHRRLRVTAGGGQLQHHPRAGARRRRRDRPAVAARDRQRRSPARGRGSLARAAAAARAAATGAGSPGPSSQTSILTVRPRAATVHPDRAAPVLDRVGDQVAERLRQPQPVAPHAPPPPAAHGADRSAGHRPPRPPARVPARLDRSRPPARRRRRARSRSAAGRPLAAPRDRRDRRARAPPGPARCRSPAAGQATLAGAQLQRQPSRAAVSGPRSS